MIQVGAGHFLFYGVDNLSMVDCSFKDIKQVLSFNCVILHLLPHEEAMKVLNKVGIFPSGRKMQNVLYKWGRNLHTVPFWRCKRRRSLHWSLGIHNKEGAGKKQKTGQNKQFGNVRLKRIPGVMGCTKLTCSLSLSSLSLS